jgi:hypothetical protein
VKVTSITSSTLAFGIRSTNVSGAAVLVPLVSRSN